MLTDRPIDFCRPRHMLCKQCDHRFVVDLDWIDQWEQGDEQCPGCGATCEQEAAPRVTADPDDIALNDDTARQLAWYHTSTHPDWPAKDFNPAADLTEITRQRMGGEIAVTRWAQRQRDNALHVGTYEAAIHNMLRRIRDQADHGRSFWLYRVHLRPSITLRTGWIPEPGDFLGNAPLSAVCPPGTDATRYLNEHEDPGGISLALGRAAIAGVQQIPIPTPPTGHHEWIAQAAAELRRPAATTESVGPWQLSGPPSKTLRARELARPISTQLPVNLRDPFLDAVTTDPTEPEMWGRYAQGLVELITHPGYTIGRLDQQATCLV